MARLGRQTAALLIGAALAAAGCTAGAGHGAAGPPATATAPATPPATRSPAHGKPCLRAGELAAAFRFRVGQGFDTVGLVLGHGDGGLVFGHQLGSDLCEWIETARGYARLGYRTLVLDFHDSDRVDDDVAAAVAELRRRGVTRVVLVGASMGGTAVLVAAARIRPPVAGVVSVSGAAQFADMDARPSMARLRVPALFMAAREDRPFPTAARGLYQAAATPDKRLLVVAGAAHGAALLHVGQDAARARAALRAFVAAHL